MGRSGRSNKKATAFIKVIRTPTQNASSLFRSRRASSLFSKIVFITCIAYALYILNHPYNSDQMGRATRNIDKNNPQKSAQIVQDSKVQAPLRPTAPANPAPAFNAASLNPQSSAMQFNKPAVAPGFNAASLNPAPKAFVPAAPAAQPVNAALNPPSSLSAANAPPPPAPTTTQAPTTAAPTPDPNCPETGCPPPSSSFGPLPSHWPQCDVTGNSNNVVFLKTHKTGSSTMSNIMLRYADTHNLTVGLPLEGKWELGGYPAYIDRRLIDPQLPSYNILGHHFRFNINKLKEFMPVDTKYITILRSPVDNVESVFGFFQDQEPFIHWMESVETTQRLGLFYANPMSYFNQDTDWFFRSRNHMFFDNGLNVLATNDEYIDQQIAALESIYAFVLLTDYFDESLILMKHLLCWDWPDVVYVKFKMRIAEAKSNITPELAAQIKSWNYADVKLYDAFNKTFWRRVEEFGFDRMESMKYEFAVMQKKAEKECIDSYQPFKKKPWILGAKLKRNPSDYCKHLAWSETVYGEHLRDKMYSTIPGLSKPTPDQKEALNTLFTQVAEGALRVT